MCVLKEHVFGVCEHTYKSERTIHCDQYRWWGCYGEEVVRIPMTDSPYCRQCINSGEDQIHKHYILQEQQVRKRAEKENWSTEALYRERRGLTHAQKDEIQGLRDMAGGGTTPAETKESTNIEAQARPGAVM